MSSLHIKELFVTFWLKNVEFNRKFNEFKAFIDNRFCLKCRLYILKNYFLHHYFFRVWAASFHEVQEGDRELGERGIRLRYQSYFIHRCRFTKRNQSLILHKNGLTMLWPNQLFHVLRLDFRKLAVKSLNFAVFYSRLGGEPWISSDTPGCVMMPCNRCGSAQIIQTPCKWHFLY